MTAPLPDVSALDRVSFDLAVLDLEVDNALNALMHDAAADGDPVTMGVCRLTLLIRRGVFPEESSLVGVFGVGETPLERERYLQAHGMIDDLPERLAAACLNGLIVETPDGEPHVWVKFCGCPDCLCELAK